MHKNIKSSKKIHNTLLVIDAQTQIWIISLSSRSTILKLLVGSFWVSGLQLSGPAAYDDVGDYNYNIPTNYSNMISEIYLI